jgi:hypothetical protein
VLWTTVTNLKPNTSKQGHWGRHVSNTTHSFTLITGSVLRSETNMPKDINMLCSVSAVMH